MNRKRMTGFIAGIGMFAFAAGIQAQIMPSTPGRPEAPMDSKNSAAKRASGEVKSVDAEKGKLIVKTATEDLHLDVQGTAAKSSLATIKVGDKVNIAYQDKGSMLVANSVTKAGSSQDPIGASSKD
jgi:Cu/Ag efflux protein CusF